MILLSILRILLWGYGLYSLLKLLLWVGLESNSPHLTFFRRWFWFVMRNYKMARATKFGPILIGYPLSVYLFTNPTPKEKFINQGFKALNLDIDQQINFIADNIRNSFKKQYEQWKDDKLYKQGFTPDEISTLRDTMAKIKQQ